VKSVSELNPGIVKVVELLNAHGFDTVDSGDGETREYACDRVRGYVVVRLRDSQPLEASANKIAQLLTGRGVSLGPSPDQVHVQANYSPIDGFRFVDIDGIHDRMLTSGGPLRLV